MIQKEELTQKDIAMIAKARECGISDLDEVGRMADSADTDEAKRELRNIWKWLYHRDEAWNDMI